MRDGMLTATEVKTQYGSRVLRTLYTRGADETLPNPHGGRSPMQLYKIQRVQLVAFEHCCRVMGDVPTPQLSQAFHAGLFGVPPQPWFTTQELSYHEAGREAAIAKVPKPRKRP